MNNYDSYSEAADTILAGAHEMIRSDVSADCSGEENYIEKCMIISIPHTFYITVNHDTQEAWIDHVRQGHSQ